MALRVTQRTAPAWLRGVLVGTRVRWGRGAAQPFIDVGVGLSDATQPVPPGGTRFNYLAVIGAGVAVPRRGATWSAGGRWWHASNNGREGRSRNPDIQALGLMVGVGWE